MSVRIVFIFLFMICTIAAQEKQITVAFEDLPRLLEQSSLQQAIINNRKAVIEAQSKSSLQWANPELNYEREQVEVSGESEREEVVSLSKTFSLPWNSLQERNIVKSELSAAEFEHRQSSNQLLANARTDYVRLSLFKKLTEKQTNLIAILADLNRTVEVRREEGAISRIDAALLSMSTFGLQTDIIQTQRAYQQALNGIKQLLGIDPLSEVTLSTAIDFIEIQISAAQNKMSAENHPGVKAHQMKLDAADRHVTLEKSKILPSISLEGGYKRINPGWEGYIMGLSIPLPLLNWNGSQIDEQKFKQRIQSAEASLYEQKVLSKTDNLVKTLRASMAVLQEYKDEQQNIKIAEDLLAAYQEGILSLSEFLNAIQIYRDGSRQHTDQLITYYETAFELEILFDQQLVKF